jgi:hypothetical protein
VKVANHDARAMAELFSKQSLGYLGALAKLIGNQSTSLSELDDDGARFF